MSEETFTEGLYAINGDVPPATWSNEITYSGTDGSGMFSPLPEGFWQVDKDTYDQAVASQQRAMDRADEVAAYDQRIDLAQRRRALVNTGMTLTQAQILLPDPLGDFSLDGGE